ncbi:MAG TPA: hypothetical protein VNT79_04125, partial [Phycisphaerae bacterium]|nr:hypothetical protein [Phycisphaerae bacterium]
MRRMGGNQRELLFPEFPEQAAQSVADVSYRVAKCVADAADGIAEAIADAPDGVAEAVADASDRVSEAVADVPNRIAEAVADVPDSVAETVAHVSNGVAERVAHAAAVTVAITVAVSIAVSVSVSISGAVSANAEDRGYRPDGALTPGRFRIRAGIASAGTDRTIRTFRARESFCDLIEIEFDLPECGFDHPRLRSPVDLARKDD